MPLIQKIQEIQAGLIEKSLDGWLLFDFRHSNPLAYSVLEIIYEKMPTRRFLFWIPAHGDPVKVVSKIEPHLLDHLPGHARCYSTWQQFEERLAEVLQGSNRIAMEYSPNGALPIVSKVDGGTIDLVRKFGVAVVSSADLLQRHTSVWSEEQYAGHLASAKVLDEIVTSIWGYIQSALHSHTAINEYDVQQRMLQMMEERGCMTDDPPTCAVNVHSADPHYCPHRTSSWEIKRGDFILLDLWCKQKQERAVYADITRVGVAGKEATAKQREVFTCVRQARDQALKLIQERYEQSKRIEGWEVDALVREEIARRGYGEWFIHRTGHNLGQEVHGPGANLDNYETRDERELLRGTAFTIEPGIYLPGEFGVRLEYDVFLHSNGGVVVSGGIQEEIMTM